MACASRSCSMPISLVLQISLGTWLGLLMARTSFARGLVRTVMVSPFMLPPVVVGMMAIVILDPSFGIANWLLARIGLPPGLWLSDPSTVVATVAALDTWQWTPFVALIVMGGYLSLPSDVFEAAEIDGASGWQRFRLVTLPLLLPTIVTAAVLRSVDLLRLFDIIYLTTQGGTRHGEHDPQHPRLSARLRVLRSRLRQRHHGDAIEHCARLGARLRAAAQGRCMVRRQLLKAADAMQLAVVLIVLAVPIAWTSLSAFKPRTEVAAIPPRLLFTPTLENFVELFGRNDFLSNTLNSMIVTTGSTLLGLALGVPAAFAVSWHRMSWPATATLFARMAPGTLFLLPWLLMFSEVGLVGSYWVLILTHAVITLPIVIWVLLPYFDAVPRELVESAQIDGARQDQILAQVVLPVTTSGIVVAAILSFIFSWNYFLFALVLSGVETKTAIVASFNFIGEGVTNWGALMAAAVVIALPPLVLTLIIQRRLVGGLAAGAVKG